MPRRSSWCLVCGIMVVQFGMLAALPNRAAFGAEFDPAKLARLHSTLQVYVDKNIVAGAVAAVGDHSGVITVEVAGRQNVEQDLPMAPDTLFRIASMTKPITALAIMMLVDEGKLSVEDPVEKHLPEFKGQMIITGRDKESATV